VYQALLTRRYLTSKVVPLLAIVAVMLCTAMVLITWSVMGGFLRMLSESGRTMIGDVEIRYPAPAGFAYYEELIARLEADPMVAAATPVIETFGMIKLPLSDSAEGVQIRGVDGPSFDRVTGYRDTLWWKTLEKPLPKDKERRDPRLSAENASVMERFFKDALTLTYSGPPAGKGDPIPEPLPALVAGAEVGHYYDRAPEGFLQPVVPEAFQPGRKAVLSVWPMDLTGRSHTDQVTREVPIVNNFKSGLYEIDANVVLFRLDALQKMLRMDAAKVIDRTGSGRQIARLNPQTGRQEFVDPEPTTVEEPARITNLFVRAKAGFTPEQLRDRCREVYTQFARDFADKRRPPPPASSTRLRIDTWEERPGIKGLIQAVKNETALVLFLFAIISFTAVFLVLAIFWAMVSEKTKDIGILRAIGASRPGITWLWLRYGLAIGLIGAALGGLASYLIVNNINGIHDWLGQQLGLVIWSPKTYYFSRIPDRVETDKAAIVLSLGVVSAVLGALVPAIKAAWMDPVKSLRFE